MSPASVFDLREENMMLENLVMLAFVAVLMFCVAFGVPTAAALIAGYVIFILYGMKKGYSVPSLLKMSWSGLGTCLSFF